MVGMAGQDGSRTVELFRQHHADELMRPGLVAEGDGQLRRRAEFGVVPVRPANGDAKIAPAVVAHAGKCRSKRLGRHLLAALIEYQDREQFKGIVDDLQRREDQLKLEHASLQKLRSALPSPIDIRKIVKAAPWPAEVAKFLGGVDYLISLDVQSDLEAVQWTVLINDGKGQNARTLTAAEFDTREKRLAICQAVAHLLAHGEGCMDDLMKPAIGGGQPALVGVFAWMAEMEAYEPAYEMIKYAWDHTAQNDPQRPVMREYYAWGLLGKANALAASGDRSTAESLIRELERNFADTRANQGRK